MLKRRARRNPGNGNTPSYPGKSRFQEKTYYNDEYREQNVFKTVVIIAAILITISVIVIVGSYAISGNDKKSEATKNIPAPTQTGASGDIGEPTPEPTQTADAGTEPQESAQPQESAEPQESAQPQDTTAPAPTGTVLKYKSDSAEVKQLQDRLFELGYLHIDETTTYFGKQTEIAVKAFQRQHGFEMNGEADEAVLAALYSSDAKTYELKDGDDGEDVTILQEMLKKLGYIDQSSVTGHYGSATRHAIRDFQDRNDLEKTSVADKETIDLLYAITSKR